MAQPVTCKTCLADNQDAIEAVGLQAMEGVISWRAAARELGWPDSSPLRNHMKQHYVAAVERSQNAELLAAEAQLNESIDDAVQDLFQAMRMAPPEVKPLYAAAIRNLQGLADTKPSQQHLISALKTIQEMTGMKQSQRMMLAFAEKMFPGAIEGPQKVPSLSSVVLEIEEASLVSTPEEVN
jgi:hypothetical protein